MAVLGSLFFSVLGWVGYVKNGFEDRVPETALYKDFSQIPYGLSHNKECGDLYPSVLQFDACRLSKNAPPEVLLIGDSHAYQYYMQLADLQKNHSVLNLGHWSCLPFSGKDLEDKNNCKEKIRFAHEFALNTSSIKTVIFAGHWKYLASGSFQTGNWGYRLANPPTADNAEYFVRQGSRFAGELIASGRQVVFVSDIPEMDFDVRSCFDMSPFKSIQVREKCGVSRKVHEVRSDDFRKLLNEIIFKNPSVKIYDPTNFLCDSEFCGAKFQEKPMYYDSDHLTNMGAHRVMQDLIKNHPSLFSPLLAN
jgi:hypothetical protein